MARHLRARVHVTDEQGKSFVFLPGSSVPDWAAVKITNPKVWDGEAPAVTAEPEPPAQPKPSTVESGSSEEAPSVPPVRGVGSSREKWVAYVEAARPDITITDEMTQREIAAACGEDV